MSKARTLDSALETDILTNELANANKPARNTVLTKDVLSQDGSPEGGMSSTIYTGNGTSQSINTGLDMATGDFGGIIWLKNRDAAENHFILDSVRNTFDFTLASNLTSGEGATTVLNPSSTGFDLTGAGLNTNTEDYVAWSFQTNKKTTGTTNRNKAYTAHYNADMNFSIVGYEGDGVDGHEIPHHLGVVPELSIIKSRGAAESWLVHSPLLGDIGDYLLLNTTAAIASSTTKTLLPTNSTIRIGADGANNSSGVDFINYNFASKSGVCKIGKYIGTGAAGNYVSTEVDGGDAFKPAFVMVKRLTSTGDWYIYDTIRGASQLKPNTSEVEAGYAGNINSVDNGFVCDSTGLSNTLNSEYIFIAFPESSIDATKAVTDYTLPTNADQLAIKESLFTFADGFNANGQVDTQELVVAGTHTFGATHEDKKYCLYRDNGVAYGQSELRPLVGLTRPDADKYGSDSKTDALALHANSRDVSKHFDYESDSGVALASGEEVSVTASYLAFNKDSNDNVASGTDSYWQIVTATNSWLQYKHNEKRMLKSWRMRELDVVGRTPKRFTIEGSNDGLNWTAIDSSYTASDYVGNGANLWGALEDTTANTTAFLYHRINITANNGDASRTAIVELELNTIIESDYYLIDEAKMYNNAGTEIDRVYYGECLTDAGGDVVSYLNYAAGKQHLNEVEVHGDLTVHGEIINKNGITARGFFDGGSNPPLLFSNDNIADIVDRGDGKWTVLFKNPMDTLDYTVLVSSGSINKQPSIDQTYKTLNGFRISLYSDAGNSYQNDYIDFSVVGGKKIL